MKHFFYLINYFLITIFLLNCGSGGGKTTIDPYSYKETTLSPSIEQINNIYDINYSKNKYFNLVTGIGIDTAIQPTTLKVYIDDKIGYNNTNNIDTYAYEIDRLTLNKYFSKNIIGDSILYSFKELVYDTDYVFDYNRQILTCSNTINPDFSIAVSYITSNGYSVDFKLIKKDSTSSLSDTFIIYDLKNRYSLGITGIDSDDTLLKLEIQDKDNSDTIYLNNGIETITLLKIFGLDKTGVGTDGVLGSNDDTPDNKIDDEYIDYTNGIISFPDKQPFNNDSSVLYNLSRPEIYNSENNSFRFRIYFQRSSSPQTYNMQIYDMVVDSEIITLNNQLLIKNIDYFMDYQNSILIFLDPNLITVNSKLLIKYKKTMNLI